MKELLEKARALYPIGTRFYSPCSGRIGTVAGNFELVSGDIFVKVLPDGKIGDYLYIYHNRNWGEILPSEPEIINNYQIY